MPNLIYLSARPRHGARHPAIPRGDTHPPPTKFTFQHTMTTDNYNYISHISTPPPPDCYFSLPLSSTHFSVETPNSPPLQDYTPDTYSDPSNPLLAFRDLSLHCQMSPTVDASRLLQLQTAAAHRPAAQPLQHSSSTSSTNSDSSMNSGGSSPSSSMLCCCRCRRESGSGMVQFGTNLYYCNHCAKMTGYCAG